MSTAAKAFARVRPIQWAVIGGTALITCSATLFGVLQATGATRTFNAAIFFILGGCGGLGIGCAIGSSIIQRRERYEVVILILFFLMAALGISYLALLQDVEPFISTLTNSVLAILRGWIVFNGDGLSPGRNKRQEKPRAAAATKAKLKSS